MFSEKRKWLWEVNIVRFDICNKGFIKGIPSPKSFVGQNVHLWLALSELLHSPHISFPAAPAGIHFPECLGVHLIKERWVKEKPKGRRTCSSLLSSQENECLLELLGRRCVVSEVTLIWGPIRWTFCPTKDFGDAIPLMNPLLHIWNHS